MKKIAIMTDSNSGISFKDGEKIGVKVVPMPFSIDGVEYYEDVSIKREQFFAKMAEGAQVKTSQPSPQVLLDYWDELLAEYDDVIYIPMSGGLSSSMMTAKSLAEDYDKHVYVVDNHRISCTQKMSVLEALKMSKSGYRANEICEILEEHADRATIYVAVDTVEHLKKGGRITAAGAAVASIMHIHPVLKVKEDSIDAYDKGRGRKAVREKLLHAIENDMNTLFKGKKVQIKGAYSCNEKMAEQWKKEIEERFPGYKISLEPLALSIGCHVGEGAVALACMEVLEEAQDILYEIQ